MQHEEQLYVISLVLISAFKGVTSLAFKENNRKKKKKKKTTTNIP